MATRTKWGFAGACSIIVGLFWGCGSLSTKTGGESHFLNYCDDDCGAGLSCISGVCTRGCVVDEDSCADLHPDAECTDESIEPGKVAVCDLACTNDAHCEELGANYTCEAGQCRGTTSVSPASGGSGGSGGASTSGGATRGSGGTTNNTTGAGAVTAGGGAGGEGPDPGVPVFPCPEDVSSDPIAVNASFVQGETLVMDVSHSGFCETHEYGLCFESELGTAETPRFTGDLRLIHDANGDPCEAYGSRTLRFDLRPYAEYIQAEQDVPGGIVTTEFGSYVFGELGCDDLGFAAGWQQREAADQTLNYGCTAATDCRVESDSVSCSIGCGVLISAAGEQVFTTTRSHIETQVCTPFNRNECPLPSPLCAERGPIDCVEGRCVELVE